MANPFYDAPVATTAGDTSPGGNSVGPAPAKGPTIIDNTYSDGNPFADQAAGWQQGWHVAQYNKYAAQQKVDQANAAKPTPLLTQIGDTITGLPKAASDILSNTINHPLLTGSSILGGALDVGPAAVNTLSHIGNGMLKSIYGAAGIKFDDPNAQIDLPLPGQTFNEYIGNNSDVSRAEQAASKMVASYELGGAAARGLGFGGVTVDALGNTIPRATLASRVAGNIIGGQMVTDPNATLADRTKQAAFDAAFGVADTAARGLASSLKAKNAASAAVTEAKNGVMTNAIKSFEDASQPSHNPEVAAKLRGFLDSSAFDGSKNMVDFETKLQEALGDSFDDPTVQSVLQPIINDGHGKVAEVVGVNKSQAAPKKLTAADLTGNLDEAKAKVDAAPKQPAKVKLVPKDDLGKDEYGNKRMAQTQVDTRTGNAVVYYDKSLDANPDAKKIVLDHEQGHVIDKQLNGGSNLSAELGNYRGNRTTLDAALGDFSKKNGMTIPEAAANLKADIAKLANSEDSINEQFADAVAKYRQDPSTAFKEAPTFSKLMEYVPQDGAISEHSTSLEGLKQESPIAGKMVEDAMSKASSDAKVRAEGEAAAKDPKNTGPAKIAGTGLDTGKTVEGKVSFNPEKINAPKDVEALFNKMEAENSSFDSARISKSDEDIKDLSRLVGLKPEDLINAKPGSIANAETLTAARTLVLTKAQSFVNDLKGIDLANASDAELKALKEKYAQLVSMQQTVAGLRTEAANTLRSLQVEVAPGEDFTLKQAFQALQDAGKKMGWDTSAFAEKVGKDVQLSTAQKIGRGVMKTWYASILSGPATPMRHGLSVMSNVVTDIISKAFNPKTFKEVIPSFKALFDSLGPAFDDAKKAFNESGPEAQAFRDTLDSNAPIFTGKWANYGKVVEFVGRYMDAAATGYTRIANEVENASLEVSSPEMSNEVQKALSAAYAESTNYLGTPKGGVTRALQAGAKAATRQAPVLRFIVPFTNVVSNVLDRQFDYVPGFSFWRATESSLSSQVDEIMDKFNLTSDADRTAIMGRLHAQQLGRAGMGVAIATAGIIAAKAGMISGSGPSNYNQKVELERTGWQPDSIKIGDMWVPYDYLGPLGGILSMVGNIHDKTVYDQSPNQDITALVTKGFAGWIQSNLNRSFLKGVADLMGAVTDQTKQQNYVKNFVSELVPIPKAITGTRSIVSGALGYEQLYQTHSVLDKLRSNIGLTGSVLGMPALNPQRNAFGEPLKASTIYGITPTFSKADAVDSYLNANDIVITIPGRNTQYTDPSTGKKTVMTGTEYDDYVKTSGKLIYQNLAAMIPSLQGEDIDSQRLEIRSMLDEVRSSVRDEVLSTGK